MSGGKAPLLAAFIRSEASPEGKWWVDVPVGLSIGEDDEYATVDAVCLTDREQELPESYPDHHGTKYVVHEQDAHLGVSNVDAFASLRERDIFAEETAALVAVDPGASSVGSVGDLLAVQELLEADWDWDVAERILVSDTDSEHVNHVCHELGVRAVRVA